MIKKQKGGYLLCYDSLQIPFQVEFGNRKTLTIHVHPELSLEVLAPTGRNIDRVVKRVDARANWIVKQWRYFEQYQPVSPPRQYISGETHLYLGRQYRLKVTKAKDSSVKLKGRYLHVRHSDKNDKETIERLVTTWYQDHAETLFDSHLKTCIGNTKSLALREPPKLVVRKMTRRWGSCTKKGNISLNVDLVKTPVHCIDYVIIHELCHLKIHNHSPAFYRLLAQCLPDWKQRKERLDSFRLE